MPYVFRILVLVVFCSFSLLLSAMAQEGGKKSPRQSSEATIDELSFNQDIRPILSDRCFLCHGPDQTSEASQETSLRLDDRERAMDGGVFDFDDPEESEMLARILSDDESDQMPPPGSHKKRLTKAEINTIRTWIKQGAKYEKHWAYVSPKSPKVPNTDAVLEASRPLGNEIDAFVTNRLENVLQRNVPQSTAAIADRATLIRRVSLDLTGLPPSVEQVDRFVNDPANLNEAYEKVVDRLLASDRYGENMARYWLDASRYADTSGYQYDKERKQWVWRDWVINAFNSNMPFDQFTIEQIAGDMLPDADKQAVLATGFNRNHPITIEGGIVDEEYRTEYVIDRVVTTTTVFMGQTFLCARCHDHKYDPISQKNFYELYSIFNNVPEKGMQGFDPREKIASPLALETIKECTESVASAKKRLDALALPVAKWKRLLEAEAPVFVAPAPSSVLSKAGASSKVLDDGSVLMSGKLAATDEYKVTFEVGDTPVASLKLEALTDPSLVKKSASRGGNGNFVLSEIKFEFATSEQPEKFIPVKVSKAEADYEQNGFGIAFSVDGKGGNKGWAVDGAKKTENRTAVFRFADMVPAAAIVRVTMSFDYGQSHSIGRFRLSVCDREVSLKKDGVLSNPTDAYLVEKYGDSQAKDVFAKYTAAKTKLKAASEFPATMVMREMPKPRNAFVLDRGEYDKPRKDKPVFPGVPESLGSLDGFPKNRLGFAKWLVSPGQPLTARVTVNRFWQQFFGTGLVKTSEDFGSQGEFPSHPDLLDWLAFDFMNGWDVKRTIKKIVMSNTYRQSSYISPESFAADPENRLLARGPRSRLDGEAIRDSALSVAGLLDDKIGGPSVYPYHPEGLWWEISNRPGFSRKYPHTNEKSNLFRRSVYTFWKRTVPPPSVEAFDAPNREFCVVRRSRTNTPLQAFVMLHDPQFVEAARQLATRMRNNGGQTLDQQIKFGFKLCTAREPSDREFDVLKRTYETRLKQYQADPQARDKVLAVGQTAVDQNANRDELAAMTQVARMLMNLSEFLTKG